MAVFARGLSDADISDLYQAATIPPPLISIAMTPQGITLTWPAGTLQYTDRLASDSASTFWIELPEATSPYVISPTAPQQFFRVRR